jgi:hypothetical protein
MHPELTDSRLIAGVAGIGLITVVGVAFYMRRRREPPKACTLASGRNTSRPFSRLGPNARPKRIWRSARSGWED